MVALTTRSLRRKAKNLCDPRAEEVRSVRFAKRGLPLTAWNDECVQTISQHRQACDLLCDPALFPAVGLEDRT